MARSADAPDPLDRPLPTRAEVEARAATRAAQRIASQLHQLIAVSLTVAELRSEREIVESLASSSRRVFDADEAILALEQGSASPLYGVAQRSRLAATYEDDRTFTVDYPALREGTSAPWIERDWLVAPIIARRGDARGVLAVRRDGGDFQGEDKEVLTLLAQMAATSLAATELSREIEGSESRLRTLVDTAPAGIVEVALSGEVVWWNRAAHVIFDWPSYDAELASTPTFPESTLLELEALWKQVREESAPATRDLLDVEVQNRRRILTVAAAPLSAPDVAPSVLMLVEDVTDHRQLRAEVQHARQMEIRGRVASSVAHDFNNLLTLISGYAEILSGELDQTPSISMVRDIQSTASRASALTAQLQTIGRSTSLEPIIFDPVSMLENNANVIERIVGDAISVTWSLAPDAGTVLIDPGQFEQMMLNLAINSRDAMPQGGELRVEVERKQVDETTARQRSLEMGTYFWLRVTDTGIGMSEETLAHCFDTFFTTKGPYKGTGMGLAAARRLVEESHGSIHVESTVGSGTQFEIVLPSAGDSPQKTSADRGVATVRGSVNVLVAEDDDGLRRLMEQILTRHGYRVTATNSGESALATSQGLDEEIALLVSDVVMGELSGPELAGRLQKERPALRVMLTSGTADASVISDLLEGSSAFLPKPFRPSHFIDAVTELLSR